MYLEIIYLIYRYREDLALNNLQWLKCHKTKLNQKFLHVDIYEVKKVKLVTVIEGDQKASFSIATTPRCRGGRYSFPWIAPLYPWYEPYIAEC